MWMTRRRSLGWMRSSVWLHCCSFSSRRRFLRSKKDIMQLAGIQKMAVNTTTVTTYRNMGWEWCICIIFYPHAGTYWRCCHAKIAAPDWYWSLRWCPRSVPPHLEWFSRTNPRRNPENGLFKTHHKMRPHQPYCRTLECKASHPAVCPPARPGSTFRWCSCDSTACTHPG